jgi:hypothetical protein
MIGIALGRSSMGRRSSFAQMLALLGGLITLAAGPAEAADATYRTGFQRWRAGANGFAKWQRAGVALGADGALRLDPASASRGSDPYAPKTYHGRNFYNGGSFFVGEATSPVIQPAFAWTQAIASWNAATPAGSWIEVLISARVGTRWTRWYNLGVWAADGTAVERHSVNGQTDDDGRVSVDTLVLTKQRGSAYRLKLRLFTEATTAIPGVRNAAVSVSTMPAKPKRLLPGQTQRWNRVLSVPECSQMVYPDGGEVWCSPTSASMVLAYWKGSTGPCEPRVRAAVAGVYDWMYDGHGNWPFNAAYAATQGLEGYVARFTSLAQAESWIAAGVPVIVSYGWKKGSLTGAPIASSNGHLAVLVGFDARGNPVVNDPAASSNATVQRTYQRAQFESLWLEHSGGTVYLIYPSGHAVPSL